MKKLILILAVLIIGCESNPIDLQIQKDKNGKLPLMEITIYTRTTTEKFTTRKVTYWDFENMINIDDTSGCGESFPLEIITGFEIYPLPNQ